MAVPAAVPRDCSAGLLQGGSGYATRNVTPAALGQVTARLEAASGDWDVAMYDKASGMRVAGSAYFGASEVAEGFAGGGREIVVQACRRSGGAQVADLTVSSTALPTPTGPSRLSLVEVSTPNPARKAELTTLGLDLTEHGGSGFVQVVLHGERDAQRLRESKFIYTTEIADLGATSRRDRTAERSTVGRSSQRAFPSGRTGTYRRLDDYGTEMKALVTENPDLVKPITLPFKTWTGRSVEGIEITENVKARDGKPVFLQMGAHHGREWPSAEHAMEWAHELVKGSRANNPRVKRLLASTRTIVVPVVNPDGFNTSREAGEMQGAGGGRLGNDQTETGNLALLGKEYQRKNCRVNNPDGPDPEQGDCAQTTNYPQSNGITQFGVDPNRNYGGFWGGPGASAGGAAPFGDFAQDYRGSAPFSEPETRNVRALVSERHVTTLITNHTFSNLLLRPPGIRAQGPPVDEPVYKALGDSMAKENGYVSEPSYNLYDTTGGTEDWTYYATGGLGYTFEIGPLNFHPPYQNTMDEYDGATTPAAGGGNREAYFKALESTADVTRHSVITGGAPAGAVLRLKKSFKTSTSPVIDIDGTVGDPILFDDTLETTMTVPESRLFEWHTNPSTRPIVAAGDGRPATGGAPSPPIVLASDEIAPMPPCPTYFPPGNPATCAAGGFVDKVFTVPVNSAGVDNGFFTVKLAFPEEADMDLEVYKANEQGQAVGAPVATSAGGSNPEQTTVGPDPEPGKYVARAVNFSGGSTYDLDVTFAGPRPFKPPVKESWTLTCEVNGQVRASQQVQIDRGQRKAVDFGAACPAPPVQSAAAKPKPCLSFRGGARDRRIARARLGRTRASQRKVLTKARTLTARDGIDRYCVKGGGTLRIGYPTTRLNARLAGVTRKRVKSKAVLMVSTNKRFKLRGLKAGSKVSTLKRRLRTERRYKVGKSAWYVARGKRSAILFRARGGKVREVGVANRTLTRRPAGVRRLLRAWGSQGL